MTLQEAIATGQSIRHPDLGKQFLVPVGSSYIVSGSAGPAIGFSTEDMARTDWELIGSVEPTPEIVVVATPEPVVEKKKK